jgi:hypothetical protein
MTREDVAIVAFIVIVVAVLWRKNVKAAASFLGLMSFTLEAKDAKRYAPASPRRPPLTEPERRADSSHTRFLVRLTQSGRVEDFARVLDPTASITATRRIRLLLVQLIQSLVRSRCGPDRVRAHRSRL